MENFGQYFVILGALVALVGAYPYIRDTLRGTTKPNRVSWFLWSITGMIATVAAISQGFSWSVIPVFMSGFWPFLVFLASFVNKNSYWQLSKFDYLCGSFSLLALLLWALSKDANVAILFAIIGDGFAATPTIIKSWNHPESENATPFITASFTTLTSFFALKAVVFAELAFPIYLLIGNFTIIFAIERKRILKFLKLKG